jgi:hypothetical protein
MSPELGPKIEANFKPGTLTRDGFLGHDSRPITEIIRQDEGTLDRLGVTREAAADFLQRLLDEGKKGLEGPVEFEGRICEIHWARGLLPCPFGEPKLHPKITATADDSKAGRRLRFSQLAIHLIREHGFFGGQGSPYRLEPEAIIEFMRHPVITHREEPSI